MIRRLSGTWSRGELSKKFSSFQQENKPEQTDNQDDELSRNLNTIAEAVAFCIQESDLFNTQLKIGEDQRKNCLHLLEGLICLAKHKRPSIRVVEQEIPLTTALQIIRKQHWCQKIFESGKDRQLSNLLKRFDASSADLQKSKFNKLASTPILPIRKSTITTLGEKPEAITKLVLDRKLIQKISNEGDERERLAHGIITPKALLFVYHHLMNSEELFEHILECLKNEKLPTEQKKILIIFCLDWLNHDLYARDLLNGEVRTALEEIVKNSSLSEEINIRIHGAFIREKLEERLLYEECGSSSLSPSSSSLSGSSCSTPTSSNLNLEVIIPLFQGGSRDVVRPYCEQFTQLAIRCFVAIPTWEWLLYNPPSPGRSTLTTTPFLDKAIETWNSLCWFVADNILSQEIADRIDRVTLESRYFFFIEVAYTCLRDGDFFSAMAIQGALGHISDKLIFLEKQPEIRNHYEELTSTLSPCNNFQQLREASRWSIPYIGLILRDFTGFKEVCKQQYNNEIGRIEHDAFHLSQMAKLLGDLDNLQCKLRGSLKSSMSSMQRQIVATPAPTTMAQELAYRMKNMRKISPRKISPRADSDINGELKKSSSEVASLPQTGGDPTTPLTPRRVHSSPVIKLV